MKGLLIKDITVMAKAMRFFPILMLCFVFADSVRPMLILYFAMFAISSCAYDEQTKWNEYVVAMPFSSFDIVFSKFALGYIGALAGILPIVIYGVVAGFAPEDYLPYLLTFFVALIVVAVDFTLIFKFGVEKTRTIFVICIGVFVGILVAGFEDIAEKFSGLGDGGSMLLVISAIVSVLFNIIAIILSVKLYERKKV